MRTTQSTPGYPLFQQAYLFQQQLLNQFFQFYPTYVNQFQTQTFENNSILRTTPDIQIKTEDIEPNTTITSREIQSHKIIDGTSAVLPLNQSTQKMGIKQTPISKKNTKTKRKSSRKSYNQGHWTKKEHRLYLQFIDNNKDIMLQSDLKKENKVFKQMSMLIKTRSPSQCRSHHQKFDPLPVCLVMPPNVDTD